MLPQGPRKPESGQKWLSYLGVGAKALLLNLGSQYNCNRTPLLRRTRPGQSVTRKSCGTLDKSDCLARPQFPHLSRKGIVPLGLEVYCIGTLYVSGP